jgi:hypothetical protein
MYVKIIRTCSDCNLWNKETKHCDEWNRECDESKPCCNGALTGMIPANVKQPPQWLYPEVRAINQKLAEEEISHGDEKEKS